MNTYLIKDRNGVWNTDIPVPADRMSNVNCHKFVLYALDRISWDEMVSDPSQQKAEGKDFTYGNVAQTISSKDFKVIHDAKSLLRLATESCPVGKRCVGQALDVQDKKLAHSFIIERQHDGSFVCFDKQGFKNYPFSVHDLVSLLGFVNDRGELSYRNQAWRFFEI